MTYHTATARDICDLALSMQQLIDDNIGQPEITTAAQLVALRAMAGQVGLLCESLGAGYRETVKWASG